MLTPLRLQDLERLQVELLRKAVELLTAEGEVVYSTCSISKKQNEEVVSKVLQWSQGQPDFGLEVVDLWKELGPLTAQLVPWGLIPSELPGALRIDPALGYAGALFMCKLKKVAK